MPVIAQSENQWPTKLGSERMELTKKDCLHLNSTMTKMRRHVRRLHHHHRPPPAATASEQSSRRQKDQQTSIRLAVQLTGSRLPPAAWLSGSSHFMEPQEDAQLGMLIEANAMEDMPTILFLGP